MRKAEKVVNQEETINAPTKRKKIKWEDEEDKGEGSPSRRKRKIPKTSEQRAEPFLGRNQTQNQKWTPLNTTLSNVPM
jgi:hypothetical protein